jgi:D-3-phosphoglycerate dehydrogenase / 2-oxoglutarate reductase
MARKVLVTDHVFSGLDPESAVLDPLGVDLVVAEAIDEDSLAALAGDAAGILVCYAPVTARVVQAASDGGCRVIARYGIGYDNVDVEAATAAGIVVTNVPDYCLDEVADHTMALLLAAVRGVAAGAALVRDGAWERPPGTIHRLAGRRLALVGLGNIGRRVAARARAFGLEVVAYDPYAKPEDGIALVPDLEAAIAEADVVSLHAPLTPETRHVVDARSIALMRRAPLLVNTARGGLVDTDAVLEALDSGALSGAALDVLDAEPPPAGHPIRSHPRAIVTPHMAFHSEEAGVELQRRAAEEVARGLKGEAPDRPVNPEVVT